MGCGFARECGVNFREKRYNISWNSMVEKYSQIVDLVTTSPTAMSTRRSGRMSSPSAPTNSARSSPMTVLAAAPTTKRRRKNTTHKCSQHGGGADPNIDDAKSLLPEPDLPGVSTKQDGGSGALSSGTCCAPSSSQPTSVVIVQVPGGFSLSQAACRLAKLRKRNKSLLLLLLSHSARRLSRVCVYPLS